ncbi:MAG: hypothetical protein MJ237_06270, partial [bacterium]|nr:hypothetical protein [bacterium]
MGKYVKTYFSLDEAKNDNYFSPTVLYIKENEEEKVLMKMSKQDDTELTLVGDTLDETKLIDTSKLLNFTAVDEVSTISLSNNGSNTPILYYSLDNKLPIAQWNQWDYSQITLQPGECVYMYGDNPNGFSASSSKYSKFEGTGKFKVSGNIQSLISIDMPDTIPNNYCYNRMFYNCSSLVEAPALPATTLANSCYSYMFYNCTSLVNAPALPATTLANECYSWIFYGCNSLVTAPELPATTLADWCYYGMFNNCTSLVTAPELPATTLADWCY